MRTDIRSLTDRFSKFAENHPQIQQFECISTREPTMEDLNYPLMWLNFDSLNFSQGNVRVTIEVIIADRITENEHSFVDAVNNCARIFNDFYTKFNENEEVEGFIFDVDADANVIQLEYDNSVCGVKGSITAQIREFRDERIIP